MADIELIDHIIEGTDRIAVPFREDAPIFQAILTGLLNETQELEDAIRDVLLIRSVDSADLARLNVLGRIVGEAQQNRDVETYRACIRARIAANYSRGRVADVAAVWTRLFGVDETDAMLLRRGLMQFRRTTSTSPIDLDAALELLSDAVSAGDRVGIMLQPASNPCDAGYGIDTDGGSWAVTGER
jgi:hypothetical protein